MEMVALRVFGEEGDVAWPVCNGIVPVRIEPEVNGEAGVPGPEDCGGTKDEKFLPFRRARQSLRSHSLKWTVRPDLFAKVMFLSGPAWQRPKRPVSGWWE